ncbi:hypothetical protein D3C72_1152900 [compost metagenome]
MVHSAEDGSIPVRDNLSVAAELQAVALAIRLVVLDNLDKVIVRQPLSNPQQLEVRS